MVHFLQSFDWEHFQNSIGRTTFRTKQNVLVVIYPLGLGMRYAYVGGAPWQAEEFEEIQKIAMRERAQFLKWEPMEQYNERTAALLRTAGFQRAVRDLQPQQTPYVDLTQDEETLLASMHHKTRYNIGLAKRRGVSVRFYSHLSQDQKEMFWRILQETAARDGFALHGKNYYFSLCDVPGMELACAEVKGQVAAVHLILFYEDKAFYLHGGSASVYRNFHASYLLQWRIIQRAKQRGCGIYDFWGINENKWPGLSHFKQGFGGKKISYVGSWDYVFSWPLYTLYRLRQRVRSKQR